MDTVTNIKNIIEETLKRLTISYDTIEVARDNIHKKLKFLITSKDSKLLIGSHGANLSAFSHVVKQMTRKKGLVDDNSDFLIDVNGYHSRRVEEIIYQAQRMAERAKLFKRDIEMLPASPYERMVVHSYFTEDPEIDTESQGEGKFRRVVLKYTAR
jgi:spoIIIJ-associated protein